MWPKSLPVFPEEKKSFRENGSISSATLMPESDLPYRKFNFLDHAKAVNPEYFLLMLGTNDSKVSFWNPAAYEEALVEMVRELAEVPSCKKVILMAPPAAFPKKGKTEPLNIFPTASIQMPRETESSRKWFMTN